MFQNTYKHPCYVQKKCDFVQQLWDLYKNFVKQEKLAITHEFQNLEKEKQLIIVNNYIPPMKFYLNLSIVIILHNTYAKGSQRFKIVITWQNNNEYK